MAAISFWATTWTQKRGRLIINDEEAAQVRAIYQLYLEHRAMIPVVQEINRLGWLTKGWITKKGRKRGGNTFTKNRLFRLLTNVIYTGKIDFKGTIYDGEHEGIVNAELWKRVQDALRRNGSTGGREVRNKYGALLKGLLYCAPCGTAMVHTYTAKKGKRYRYYVCLNAQQRGWTACPTKSLNAHEIETAVIEHIRGIGGNEEIIAATAAKVRQASESRLAQIDAEKSGHERELKRLHFRMRKLIGECQPAITNDGSATDQLADLQDQIRTLEQRITAIREEIIAIHKEAVDEGDIARALAIFDPVWESLSPREQSRIFRLLIERVGYDGAVGKVTVTFRSPGVKSLCGSARAGSEMACHKEDIA